MVPRQGNDIVFFSYKKNDHTKKKCLGGGASPRSQRIQEYHALARNGGAHVRFLELNILTSERIF